MTKQDIQKNFKLSSEFDRYVMENPEIMKGIPSSAVIVFAPQQSKRLTLKNIAIGRKILKKENQKVFKAIRSGRSWTLKPLSVRK